MPGDMTSDILLDRCPRQLLRFSLLGERRRSDRERDRGIYRQSLQCKRF